MKMSVGGGSKVCFDWWATTLGVLQTVPWIASFTKIYSMLGTLGSFETFSIWTITLVQFTGFCPISVQQMVTTFAWITLNFTMKRTINTHSSRSIDTSTCSIRTNGWIDLKMIFAINSFRPVIAINIVIQTGQPVIVQSLVAFILELNIQIIDVQEVPVMNIALFTKFCTIFPTLCSSETVTIWTRTLINCANFGFVCKPKCI